MYLLTYDWNGPKLRLDLPVGIRSNILTACHRTGEDFPYVILVNLNLPVLDGLDFLESYKRFAYHLQHPTLVYVLTTSRSPKHVEGFRIAPHLFKPLVVDTMWPLYKASYEQKRKMRLQKLANRCS